MAVINFIVEGEIDEAVAFKIASQLGHQIGNTYGKKGHGYIKVKIKDFNKSANTICYLALVDFMDTKCKCPSDVISNWLPSKNELMFFRVVVREIESWVMADRKNIAKFLKVPIEKIPIFPEAEIDPKQKLVNIARGSHSHSVISSLVPEQNSTALVGNLYNSEIKRFVLNFWDINLARLNSPSLDRCLKRLEEI